MVARTLRVLRAPSMLVTVGLLLVAPPLDGHHSVSGEFDANNPVTFTGKVLKVEWMNPHIYTYVEVTEGPDAGKVYKVEGGAPNSLFRRGWRMDTLAVDEIVDVSGLRARNTASPNVGQARITTSEGLNVFSGTYSN